MKRRVLITGGAGFIGANLAHHLLEETDAHVHVLDNLSRDGVSSNLESLRDTIAADPSRLKITVGDVRDAALMERAVAAANEVYHFAAQVAVTTSVLEPRRDFDVNLGGTFNVLEGARKAGHRPFMLFTSTNKVYGDMGGEVIRVGDRHTLKNEQGISETTRLDFHSPYGCSKGAADQYVRDYARIYGIPTVVFRMSCIAGLRQMGNEDQGWVAHFVYAALQGKTLMIYGDGRQVRDVLNVNDLLRAFEAARDSQSKTAGQIYNIGGGPENTTSLLEQVERVESLTGRKITVVYDECRPGDQQIYVTDFSKFTADTGWRPAMGIDETTEQIRAWWLSNRSALEESMSKLRLIRAEEALSSIPIARTA